MKFNQYTWNLYKQSSEGQKYYLGEIENPDLFNELKNKLK